jgi:carboxyl-terminal processing protease
MKQLLTTILAVTVLSCAPTSSVSPERQAVWESPAGQLVNQAFNLIETKYFGYSKVNLPKLIQRYRADLETICIQKPKCTAEVGEEIITRAIKTLSDKHTYYSTRTEVEAEMEFNQKKLFAGYELDRIPGELAIRIIEVTRGSIADEGGLERGDKVIAYNGKSFKDVVPFLGDYYKTFDQKRPVKLTVLRGSERRTLILDPKKGTGGGLPWLENLKPGMKRLVLRSFVSTNPSDVAEEVHKLIQRTQAEKTTSLIVDLRTNRGGYHLNCLGAVGAFIGPVAWRIQSRAETNDVGYANGLVTQSAYRLPIGFPINAWWRNDFAVLVGPRTASCAEVFAYNVQSTKSGRIFGQTTYGVANTGWMAERLMNGSILLLTESRNFRADGVPYPEKIVPDIILKSNLEDFVRTGIDAELEAVVKLMSD